MINQTQTTFITLRLFVCIYIYTYIYAYLFFFNLYACLYACWVISVLSGILLNCYLLACLLPRNTIRTSVSPIATLWCFINAYIISYIVSYHIIIKRRMLCHLSWAFSLLPQQHFLNIHCIWRMTYAEVEWMPPTLSTPLLQKAAPIGLLWSMSCSL